MKIMIEVEPTEGGPKGRVTIEDAPEDQSHAVTRTATECCEKLLAGLRSSTATWPFFGRPAEMKTEVLERPRAVEGTD